MQHLILFLGSSDVDSGVRRALETWVKSRPDIRLDCQSIHNDPSAVLRFGISQLPALALGNELIAQGRPEEWVALLLDLLIEQDKTEK